MAAGSLVTCKTSHISVIDYNDIPSHICIIQNLSPSKSAS